MTIPIRVEPEADDELVAAFEWYEARRLGLGQDFVDVVDEALASLAEMPGASTPVPGVPRDVPARRVFIKRFPYTVIFLAFDHELVVLAFAHMKRSPGYWLARVRH